MSSFGSQMRKRFEQLRKAGENVPKIMAEVAEGATIAAVETAVNNTPPNNAAVAGTNTRSGEMAQSWQDASVTTPTVSGGNVTTTLANIMQYASYVNDGHRMDKHFVPGLTVNGGLLEKTKDNTGITVGTKTTYVPGIHMKEKAIGKYRTTVRKKLDKRVREAFK